MGPPPAKTPSTNRSNDKSQTKRSGNTGNSEMDSDIERLENEAELRAERREARNESGDEAEEEEDPFTDRPRQVNLLTVDASSVKQPLACMWQYSLSGPTSCFKSCASLRPFHKGWARSRGTALAASNSTSGVWYGLIKH
jgi:hypothetical protein